MTLAVMDITDPWTCARTPAPVGAERAHLREGFGRLVRAERLDAGLKRADLARLSGFSESIIKKWEIGTARPSETATRALAETFRRDGTPVDVAELDLRLQRAAGPSLRRWRRTRTPSLQRRRAYATATARLAEDAAPPSNADRVAAGRAAAALSEPWRPQ